MAYFAQLDATGIVKKVIVVADSDTGGGTLDTESVGISFCQNHVGDNSSVWKQTSYNRTFRGNYAGIGMTYAENVRTLGVASTDVFLGINTHPSWSVGVNTAQFYPPANPGDAPTLSESDRAAGKYYVWNETDYNADPSTAWNLITP